MFVCWNTRQFYRRGWAVCHVQGQPGRTLCGIRTDNGRWVLDYHDEPIITCARCKLALPAGKERSNGQQMVKIGWLDRDKI